MEFHARNSNAYRVATRLAADVRSGRTGRICVLHVADQLGVEIAQRRLAASLHGVTTSASLVTINSVLAPPASRWAIAHELAHVLVRRRVAPAVGSAAEEQYADEFANELLIPLAELENMLRAGHQAGDIANVFDVEKDIVILRLMRLGAVDPIGRSADGRVHCLDCGVRPTRPACKCVRYRQGDAGLRLPLLIA